MKKQYISPISEMMDLRTMNAMMDDTPLFGNASNPKDPFTAPERQKVF